MSWQRARLVYRGLKKLHRRGCCGMNHDDGNMHLRSIKRCCGVQVLVAGVFKAQTLQQAQCVIARLLRGAHKHAVPSQTCWDVAHADSRFAVLVNVMGSSKGVLM